jgi:hypothetical protein
VRGEIRRRRRRRRKRETKGGRDIGGIKIRFGMAAHTCNSSYFKMDIRRIMVYS